MTFMRLVKALYSFSRVLVAVGLVCTLMVSLLSPALAAGGQNGNLNGQIIDAATNAPIANARVTIAAPSGTYRATTDARGQFTILGIVVDTYTVSVEAPSYDIISQAGVTIVGDQNVSLGAVKLVKTLRTIGRVTSRSPSAAFQPGQTIDSVTVNAGRIIQSTGKANSTDEHALLLSVPGTSLTSTGAITVRGGLRTEVGYQFDGIPYTEPFFSQNGSNAQFSGLGQVQVVEGAGDATQGNVGGGVVNLVPKRGTNPPFGTLDAEIGGPGAFHQGALEYGMASPNGKFSNYFSYTQNQGAYYYGTSTLAGAPYGNFYSNTYSVNTDLIDNFIFKFGKSSNQSLQVLYENRDLRQYGPYGGLFYGTANPSQYFQYDPYAYGPLGLADELQSTTPGVRTGAQYLAQILPPLPGQLPGNVPPTLQQQTYNPTQLLKFEYDNNITPTTFLDLKVYNASFIQGNSSLIGQTSSDPNFAATGGRRSGLISDLIHQFGPNYTLTFNVQLENQHPVWDGYYPFNLAQLLTPGLGGNPAGPRAPADYQGAPSLADFLPLLPNGSCPVTGGCYLSNYFANGQIPQLPVSGINYNGTLFQTFGFGVRNQINVGAKTKLDLGARYEGAIYKFGSNPFNTSPFDTNYSNPSDVPPSALTNQDLNPREIEPRAAVSYQFGRDDSIRFGYGRSTTFLNAQTAGTPAGLYNANSLLKVPALDTVGAPGCGSGTNPAGLYKCPNYAQQLYWLYDQNFDAPDLGGATAQVASNYDMTYQHQFRNGFGLRLTPFYKLSSSLPSFALISETTDPVSGAILSETFTANNLGINRTTGVEFGLTSPQRATGIDGFLTMTYQNVLTSAPPLINGEDSLPIISSGSLAIGNVYRAGYVSPFVARLGAEYKTKSGFRFAPVLQYDRGYPFNVGNTIASRSALYGTFQNIPQVNFGAGRTTIPGFEGATGAALATNFVDPANPGNAFHPNIAATRGTPESASAGGVLFHPNLSADMTIEYKAGRNTLGVQARNFGGNAYNGVIPTVNPYYQPVSTGVAGPQTSQPKQANPDFRNGIYQNRGYGNIPADANAFTNAAYLLTGSNLTPSRPTTYTLYYQLAL